MFIANTNTPAGLVTRQTGTVPNGYVVTEDGTTILWWYSKEGYIVKWSIFLGFVTLVTLWLSISYCHAKKRIKKGLAPLRYHRWMVHRQDLARVDAQYAYPQATYTQYPGNSYGMTNMAPPPPMYDPSAARPPNYDAPPGAAKLDLSQWRAEPAGRPEEQTGVDYAPPPGPPPAR